MCIRDSHCAGDEELDKLFESAACEVTAALERLKSLTENQEEEELAEKEVAENIR